MMNKKEYMAPWTVMHCIELEKQMMAGSEQSPWADAKPNHPIIDDEDDWLDDEDGMVDTPSHSLWE